MADTLPNGHAFEPACPHAYASSLLDGLCPRCFESTILDGLERTHSRLLGQIDQTKVALAQARRRLREVWDAKPGFHCPHQPCEFLTRSLDEYATHLEAHEGAREERRAERAAQPKAAAKPKAPVVQATLADCD